MEELYNKSKDFREYVDKYCTKHKVSKEQAFEHQLIKAIATLYEVKTQKRKEGGTV